MDALRLRKTIFQSETLNPRVLEIWEEESELWHERNRSKDPKRKRAISWQMKRLRKELEGLDYYER